jgi:hypothetical protein
MMYLFAIVGAIVDTKKDCELFREYMEIKQELNKRNADSA